MNKAEKIYKASFIALMVFAWVYFGSHVLIHIVWG